MVERVGGRWWAAGRRPPDRVADRLGARLVHGVAGALGAVLVLAACSGARTTSLAVAPAAAGATSPPDAATRPPATAASQVYEWHGASVVNVTSLAVVRTRSGSAEVPRGVGSGFIWDAAGHIVTNSHVVEDASQLAVTFQNRTTVPATLLGRDEPNDLAVLRVDPDQSDDQGRPIRDRLRPVVPGDSDRVTIGEEAIAIGSPLGLQQTVTAGIVSAVRLPGEEATRAPLDLLGGAIQTDAAINPGNSGGPLFNAAGEVIGVNTAILSGSGGNIGLGFAIPINVVKRVAPELIQSGCYRHPLIGVSTIPLAALGPPAKQALGLPANQPGLLVQEASAGAAVAGLRAGERVVLLGGEPVRAGGDIVLAIDGQAVSSGSDLRAYVENRKRPGEQVTLDILRADQRLQVTVTLDERPGAQTCRP
jgi:2-alkenal reductase